MSASFAKGQVLAGKYRIERVLGRGGMGVVVLATHLGLGHKVAIKLLLDGANSETATRFTREARASVRLKSEHVARVLDVGELDDRTPYMVMEYLEGSDLAVLSKERGAFPIGEAVLHVLHVCEAIAEAHASGIIHRDLKPANLLLAKAADGTGQIKVLDFGISKTLQSSSDLDGEGQALTQTAAMLGSPNFMAPEQMRSARDVDPRADLWSLGAILYQLLTGVVPFKADSFAELVMMVNMDPPPPPSSLRPDLPPALEAVVLRCLEKRAEDRFPNAAELAIALAPFGADGAIASAERAVRTLEKSGVALSVRSGSLAPPGPSSVSAATPASSPSPSIAPPSIAPPSLSMAPPSAASPAMTAVSPGATSASLTAMPLPAGDPAVGSTTALESSGPSLALPPRSSGKWVPLAVTFAVLLGVAAVALAMRPRPVDPGRIALAEPGPPLIASTPRALDRAAPAPSAAPTGITITPADPAPPTAVVSAAPPPPPVIRAPPVPRPTPPPAPTGKKSPLDIQIK